MNQDNFITALNELQKTNLLNALEGIKKVLIVITSNKELTDALKKVSTGFDFSSEFERAFLKNNICFEDNEKYVALVTSLLYQLDIGNIKLEDFLSVAYPKYDKNKAYQTFLEIIMLPYGISFKALINGQLNSTVKDTKPKDLEKINQDIKLYINAICQKVECNDNIEKLAKDEALTALYGFNYVLGFDDTLLTRIVYSGLVNTLFLFRLSFEEMEEVAKLLKIYGVL